MGTEIERQLSWESGHYILATSLRYQLCDANLFSHLKYKEMEQTASDIPSLTFYELLEGSQMVEANISQNGNLEESEA